MRKVFKLRLWGLRLGPSDVPHPLLTSVHSPFNLLLKMTFIEAKQITSSCKIRMHVTVSVS